MSQDVLRAVLAFLQVSRRTKVIRFSYVTHSYVLFQNAKPTQCFTAVVFWCHRPHQANDNDPPDKTRLLSRSLTPVVFPSSLLTNRTAILKHAVTEQVKATCFLAFSYCARGLLVKSYMKVCTPAHTKGILLHSGGTGVLRRK